MANGAFNFKNNSGNIVSFISGSDSNIIMSGGTLDLSGMSGLTLGNLTMEGTVETASFAPNYLLTSSFNTYSGTTNTVIGTLQTSTGSLNSFTSSTTSRLSSIETSTSSLNTFTSSATNRLSSIEGVTGSYATTGSNIFRSNQTITGSLFITENLVVAGSSSIQHVSSSVLNIADNIITVNALNPSLRFGGLAVIDSGSSPQVSGSMLFDSVNNQWIFVHQNQSTVTSSVLLMGPETYDNLGNESYLTLNRLPKGTGIEHLVNSNITDTGTKVSINSNTEVTGSLITTGAGTFSGNVGINGSPGTSFPLEVYINSSTTYTTSSRGNVFRVYNSNTSANVFAGIELGGAGTANDGLAGINGVVTGSGNGALTFYTRNSNTFLEKMRINSDGNVGVGTTSPTNSRLLVAGSHVSGNSILGVVPVGNNTATIGLYNSSNVRTGLFYSDTGFLRIESDADPIQIYAAGTTGLTITTTGNVLLGTTSTGADGLSLNNGRNLSFAEGSGESYANIFRQRNTAATVISSGYKRSLTDGFASSFSSGMARAAIAVGYNNGSIAFFSDSSSTVANGTNITPTERMTILNNGNVGIGVTNPASKFYVVGGTSTYVSTSPADYTVSIQDPTSMAINVGGSILFQGYKTSNTAVGNYGYITGRKENGTAGNEAGYLALGTFDSAGIGFERMRLNSTGNISAGNGLNSTFTLQNDGTFFGGSGSATIFRLIYGGAIISQISNTGTGQRDGVFSLRDEGVTKINIAANASRGGDTYFNNGGRVGINTDSPNARLHIADALSSIMLTMRSGNDTATGINFTSSSPGGGSDNYTINHTILHGSGGGYRIEHNVTGRWIRMIAGTGGVELAGAATSWTSISDIRKKDVLQTGIPNALDKINNIDAIFYKYKNEELLQDGETLTDGVIEPDQPIKIKQRRVGLIAQQIHEVLPEAINYNEEEDVYKLSYTEMIPLLVEAIKEQQIQIESLKTEIQTLKQ